MSKWAIETSNVSFAYGREPVLRGVELRVARGSIYGFLGRNGAGKSTLIRMLVGLGRPGGGSIRVLGEDPLDHTSSVRARVGYMADSSILPYAMKASDLLDWNSRLYPVWDKDLVARLASRFRLDLNKRIEKLSLGQQRQVAFVLALASKPDLLILDEPAANLDTVARRAFLDEILVLLREENKTVFFSTHILGDVERVADHVGILAGGKILVSESMDDLKESICDVRFFWEQKDPPPVVLGETFGIQKGPGEVLATLRVKNREEIGRLAEEAGCRWEIRPLNLEDLFVSLTHQEGEIV